MRDLERVRQTVWIDNKTMILAGDLNPTRGEILDRMIGAVVALMHLRRFCSQRPAEQLMAKAWPAKEPAAMIALILLFLAESLPARQSLHPLAISRPRSRRLSTASTTASFRWSGGGR